MILLPYLIYVTNNLNGGFGMDVKEKVSNSAVHVNYHIYTAKDAKNLFNDRDLYIWGAGLKGRGFKKALERNGFKIKAFLDSSPLLIGSEYDGTPILEPQAFLKNLNKKNVFILTATVDKKNKEIFAKMENAGLKKGKDFINIQELCPYYPVVEISGICNLRCISCPRGSNKVKKGGFMRTPDYLKIINKLITEIPFLYLVDLYIWGEPLLNPDLPEIIKINNHLGISSGISSNLNVRPDIIEKVIKASPQLIRVSLSGYGKTNYEITHTGGKWKVLYENLNFLADLIKKYQVKTIVEIYFHVNKKNLPEAKKMQQLCAELNFRFHPSIHMIFPDYVMDYIEGNELNEATKHAKDLMVVSLDEMIDKAKKEQNKSCLLKRIIPVINWDMSVVPCCNYSYQKLADNYLNISLPDVILLRKIHPLCNKCQNLSLHRYFDPVYYSDYINNLLNSEAS